MIGTESICAGSRSSPTPSVLMIQEIDPTMKIWLGCGRDKEPIEKAILFDKEIARSPLPGAPTIDKISSAVLRGVSHEDRLIGRGACDQKQEGNRGHQYDVIPYSYGLLDCIGYHMIWRVFGGGPCPPYTVHKVGLQVG